MAGLQMGHVDVMESSAGLAAERLSAWLGGASSDRESAKDAAIVLNARLGRMRDKLPMLKDVQLSEHVLDLLK